MRLPSTQIRDILQKHGTQIVCWSKKGLTGQTENPLYPFNGAFPMLHSLLPVPLGGPEPT